MRSEPLLILGAPLNHAGRNLTGIWGVNRQGCRFSRPQITGGLRAHRAQASCRVVEQERFAYFGLGRHPGFCKVSRRQGGTLGGRYRRNGYVHNPTALTARPPSRASPLPQLDRGVLGREVSPGRPLSQASQLPQLESRGGGQVERGQAPSPQQRCVHLLDQVISACTGASRPMACRRA